MNEEQKKQLYNILADFALKVDELHSVDLEPSCEEEMGKIEEMFELAQQQVIESIRAKANTETFQFYKTLPPDAVKQG